MRAAIAIAVLAGLAGWWPAMADEASRSYAEAPAAMQAKVIKVLESRGFKISRQERRHDSLVTVGRLALPELSPFFTCPNPEYTWAESWSEVTIDIVPQGTGSNLDLKAAFFERRFNRKETSSSQCDSSGTLEAEILGAL